MKGDYKRYEDVQGGILNQGIHWIQICFMLHNQAELFGALIYPEKGHVVSPCPLLLAQDSCRSPPPRLCSVTNEQCIHPIRFNPGKHVPPKRRHHCPFSQDEQTQQQNEYNQ
jgi:hypothetical protein